MQTENRKNLLAIFLAFITMGSLLGFSPRSEAETSRAEQLRLQIEERNKQVADLEKEISVFNKELEKVVDEKESLKKQVNSLEITRKKLIKDISLTEKKIEIANINIERLSLQVRAKGDDINRGREALGETLKSLNQQEATSLTEIVLQKNSFSDFFNELEALDNFQQSLNSNLYELKDLKSQLESREAEERAEKKKLEDLKATLSDQKTIAEINKKEKDSLLAETKNKESNYKNLIEQKNKLRQSFEKELADLESQLKIEIDPKSLPKTGSGVLRWPFLEAKMAECEKYKTSLGNIYCITQYFGNTPFATSNPQLYKSGMHKGIDFRAPVGTPVVSAEKGKIIGVGNTDLVCKNASYGKWILVEHENGLSTIYAHLSLIKVAEGDEVEEGQVIAYSGNTGSSTGPHLHFMVLASKGVSVSRFPSSACGGKMYVVPVASYSSYLNPLSYL